MSAGFPSTPLAYDKNNEAGFRDSVRRLLDACFSRGRDIEVGKANLILTDTVTGDRYAIQVVSGAITATAL